MRRSVIAGIAGTAVTAATVAKARARKPAAPRSARPPAVLPEQRTALERLVEGDAELVVAEQEACDEAILQALDALVSRAG